MTVNYVFLVQIASGNELSRWLVNSSIELFEATGASWQRIWDIVVNPTQPMWIASVAIAKFFLGFSLLIFAFLAYRKIDGISTTRQLVDEIPLPLALGFLITGNGKLLADLVLGLRAIFQYFIVMALKIQVAGISVNEALHKIQNTAVVNNRARIIFSDCLDKTGTQLTECVNDPVKIAQARQMLTNAGSVFNGNALEAILDAITGNITAGIANAVATVIASPVIAIIQTILLVLQHAFINLIEAASVLTAISAPIFLSFSLFTPHAPAFLLWLISYTSLFFVQLGYVALIGFNASVISLMETAGQPVGSTILDLSFLFFMAVFAPALAFLIAGGGGILLYNKIQDNLIDLAAFAVKFFA